MSDLNLYPVEPVGVRRRRRRVPRPAHLPPFDPAAATAPTAPTLSPRRLPTAPPAATFGAPAGANNALLFHQLRQTLPTVPMTTTSDKPLDESGGEP